MTYSKIRMSTVPDLVFHLIDLSSIWQIQTHLIDSICSPLILKSPLGHIRTIIQPEMLYLFFLLILFNVDAQYFKEKIDVMTDYDWEKFFLGLVQPKNESEEPLFPEFPLSDNDFRLINFWWYYVETNYKKWKTHLGFGF